jgi:hypothetical protein
VTLDKLSRKYSKILRWIDKSGYAAMKDMNDKLSEFSPENFYQKNPLKRKVANFLHHMKRSMMKSRRNSQKLMNLYPKE